MALSPASRATLIYLIVILWLAPQALCCHSLRELLLYQAHTVESRFQT